MRPAKYGLVRQSVILTAALAFAACTDTDNLTQPNSVRLFATPTGLLTANPPQIFIGAGDISSCSNTADEATAEIIDTIPGTVYLLGDDAYDNGTTAEFANCYDPTWGRFKSRTKPSAGNHEYNTSGAAPYFAYFGPVAGTPGQGWYSYNLGAWHIIVLNSNIILNTGGAQDLWLKADLAAHPNQCTLAYFHHPLYSSTGGTGSSGTTYSSSRMFMNDLYAGHADLVLAGHRHFYERLAPMAPDGSSDPTNGTREIIVGSGGIGGGTVTNKFPLSQVANGDTRGVLKLYLYDDSYAWKFIPIAGKTFTDTGSTACHFSGGGGGGGGGGVISAGNSTVSVSPSSFTAGSGSSIITVTAKDGTGATMSGAAVSLAASGSGNTLTPLSGTTDGTGKFTSTLTSTVAETKTITATINSTVITQQPTVTVNPSGGGGGGGGGTGTITQSLLTAGFSATDAKVYTTASIAPAANALITVAIRMRRSSGAQTPTLTGGGMSTWTLVTSTDYDPVTSSGSRVMLFRAMSAAPGGGALTMTFANSASNVEWAVSQWTGVDQTGTNGSGAIGQTDTTKANSTTSLSTVLPVFGGANNVALGVVGATTAGPAVTPGSGFTEITEQTSGESTLLEAELGLNLNSVSATLSRAANAGLLAVEIRAGAGGEPVVSPSLSTLTATSPITAGGTGSTITVTAKDGSGNPVSGATVVLSATGSNNTVSAIGPTDVTGVATATLTSTKAENKVVSATINGVSITQQATVTVQPGVPAVLAFTGQPTSTSANAPITPAVTVETRDAFGNHANSSVSVTMAFGANPGSGILAGTTSQTAVAGVATFSDLAINNIANGYTLTASATALTGATSNTFNITQAAPSASLSTVVAGTATFAAGGSSSITVTVKDGLGNAMSGIAVTLSSSVGGDVVTQPAGTTNGSGVATGSVSATSAGPRTVTAVAGGVTLSQKPGLTVTAGPANAGSSTVSAAPTSIVVGSGSSTITVTVKDAFGNPVAGSAVVVSASGTGNTFTPPSGSSGANGVFTSSLSSSNVQTETVSATADGIGVTQSPTVSVTSQPSGITQALLTSGTDSSSVKIFTTASIAPAANALITVAVVARRSGGAQSPTLVGGGMSTWTLVASVDYNPISTPASRIMVFRAMSAAPGSGPLTLTFANSQNNVQWVVSQWAGVDQTGTNGSGAIVQSGSTRGDALTSLSVPLAAFGNVKNVGYGLVGAAIAGPAVTPGAGFTEIAETTSGEGTLFEAEMATNINTIVATLSKAAQAGAVGIEIKAGP
jgi:hypothetical protein